MQLRSRQSAEASKLRPLLFVIEDDEALRTETVLLLEDRGYDVVDCADAKAALDRLKTGAVPDLILLDLIMPVMDGFEFRVQQKQVAEWVAIPVITMSGDRTVEASALDTQVHLTKPFELANLLKAVDEQLHTLERTHLHQRSRHRAQLSALARMAASVACETDNPITFVLGTLELAQKQCRELEARLSGAEAFSLVGIRQLLARGTRGAEHITSLARRISVFATLDASEVLGVDVAEVIDASLTLLRNELRSLCLVERDLPELPTITTQPGKLALLLLNLFLTALESMRAVPGRSHRLRIGASTSVGTVTISISDTGKCRGRGIEAAVLSSADEPISSHRDRLTGLTPELALSCELVRELGGVLNAKNNTGDGSMFEVTLPLDANSADRACTVGRSASIQLAGRPRPRILLVATDPVICRLLVSLLARAYEVVAVTKPALALLRLRGQETFDVVLCEWLMPAISGITLYERAVHHHPTLEHRFIFMADDPYSGSVDTMSSGVRNPLLRKPFQYDELVDMIEALLSTKH
jgi:CheY-like chemotaxis protein